MTTEPQKSMEVCVIGMGYIGLPTALMLASHGICVKGVDYNKDVVAKLQAGHVTFKEEGLSELFDEAVRGGITFHTDYPSSGFYIIAVPTPYNVSDKKIDPSFVVNALKDVLAVAKDEAVITIESTISPGTVDKYLRPVVAASGKHVHLAHAPERIIPGRMLKELRTNARTIGADEPGIAKLVQLVYQSFCEGEIVLTDIRTAEMSKVVENTFRDINIAYANELAKICRKNGMDVYEVIRIANKHPRVNILQPGPGVGGHCISVDPWFLVGDFPEEAKLIRQAREVNSHMPDFVLQRIKDIMKEHGLADWSRVGLYGLTYKEDVDDTRESPTLQLFSTRWWKETSCRGRAMISRRSCEESTSWSSSSGIITSENIKKIWKRKSCLIPAMSCNRREKDSEARNEECHQRCRNSRNEARKPIRNCWINIRNWKKSIKP